MIRNRVLWTVLGVGAVAFAAGRLAAPIGVGSVANADPLQDKAVQHEEMAPEMQAYMEAMTPGDHHRHLDALVGRWEGEVKIWMHPDAEPMVMPATIDREWILDGHFVQERVESMSEMGTFQGLGFLGYNNLDGVYQVGWLENHSTAMMFGTGSYDPASKIMTTRGSHRDPATGKMIYSRGELDMSNPKRQVMYDYATGPDGKEYLSFKGVFEKIEK